MSTIKRVFFYMVSFVTLGTFAGGVGTLLSLCFDILVKRETWQGFARGQLSLGLAMLIIGGILWFLFWRTVRKQVSENPAEIGSGIRKLFLNLTRGVAALIGLNVAVDFLRWLMAGVSLRQFPSAGLAMLIVTAGIWYYHWRLEEKEGQPSPVAKTMRRWYVYALSGFGLVSMVEGLILLVNAAVFYLPAWGGNAIHGDFWNYGVQGSIGWILIGGSTWAFHWFYMARGDYDSTLRQVYMYLVAILGGVIAGLVALTTTLYNVFRFAFGGVSAAGGSYFQFLGWTIPTMLVATAIWAYHQKAVQEEAAQLREKRLSTRRVYLYVMSFIGLSTLIAGLVILLGILLNLWIHAASSGVVVTSGWWRDQLSIFLALLLVGTPLWLFYWRGILRMVAEGDVAERGATSRRIFLYVVLGIAVITLAVDLVYIVYQILNVLLQGTSGANILRNLNWFLQTMFVSLPVLIYHWRILRQDQRLGAEKLPLRKIVTLMCAEPSASLVYRIEEKLGYHIRLLRCLGPAPEDIPSLSDEEIEAVAGDVQAAPSDKVMLVAAGGKVIVLPYEEK